MNDKDENNGLGSYDPFLAIRWKMISPLLDGSGGQTQER